MASTSTSASTELPSAKKTVEPATLETGGRQRQSTPGTLGSSHGVVYLLKKKRSHDLALSGRLMYGMAATDLFRM